MGVTTTIYRLKKWCILLLQIPPNKELKKQNTEHQNPWAKDLGPPQIKPHYGWKYQVKVFFHAQGPGVGEGFPYPTVVHREKNKVPCWIEIRFFAKLRPNYVNEKHGEITWQNSKGTFQVEGLKGHAALLAHGLK